MTSFLQIFSINSISPTKKTISSRTTIGLEVDPPAPFKYFGKSILETTGRLALSIALSEIGNAFVQVLSSSRLQILKSSVRCICSTV